MLMQPHDLEPVASPARQLEYSHMAAAANALLSGGSTVGARQRFQLLEDASSTACTRTAALPRSVRELVEQERRYGHLTARRPAWRKGERVEIARKWRKPHGALSRDPEVLDPALNVVIRAVDELRLGDLVWKHAEQLGHRTVNEMAVEWLDARQPAWRDTTRTVTTVLYDEEGEPLVDEAGDWITEQHQEPWRLENPSAAQIHAAWRAVANTTAWLTRWTIVIPHETRQLPQATKQKAYVEHGGLVDEPEAVDRDTLVRFVHYAAPGITAATETTAAKAVDEVNAKVESKRQREQRQRTERRQRRKAALKSPHQAGKGADD